MVGNIYSKGNSSDTDNIGGTAQVLVLKRYESGRFENILIQYNIGKQGYINRNGNNGEKDKINSKGNMGRKDNMGGVGIVSI